MAKKTIEEQISEQLKKPATEQDDVNKALLLIGREADRRISHLVDEIKWRDEPF